jgi:hypothetical protein
MATYFFDFRAGDVVSLDEEGEELADIAEAHQRAAEVLADAIQTVILEGKAGQHFAVEVRDELGPVLELSAVLGSKILRKQ